MEPSERFERSMTNDNLWVYILILLKKKDMYTYEINSSIKSRFGFEPGNITAYIVLKRLQVDGYVRISKKERKRGPTRTYYSISKKGERELKKAYVMISKTAKIFKGNR